MKLSKLQKEKDFLQQTSESLLRNQDDFRTQLIAEQTKSKAKDAQITDLTEQVCNLFSPGRACCMASVVLSSTPTCTMRHTDTGEH